MKTFSNSTKRLIFISMACVLFSVMACKKDNPQPEEDPPGIVGFWSGKYGGVDNYPTNGYSFLFREDGTVRVFNGADTALAAVGRAEGIYSILGSTVTTNYTYLDVGGATFSTTATVNAGFTFLEGTWDRATILLETAGFFSSSSETKTGISR